MSRPIKCPYCGARPGADHTASCSVFSPESERFETSVRPRLVEAEGCVTVERVGKPTLRFRLGDRVKISDREGEILAFHDFHAWVALKGVERPVTAFVGTLQPVVELA